MSDTDEFRDPLARGVGFGPHAVSAFATLCLAALMLAPLPAAGPLDVAVPFADKLVHFVLFFGWAATVRRSLRAFGAALPDLWVVGLAVLFGMALEGLQGLGSSRQPELLDVLSNAAGAWFYVVLIRFLDRRS